MDVWHKETTPGTTGSRCTIRDGSGLFVAECIASDAAMITAAPAMLAALRKADALLHELRGHELTDSDSVAAMTAVADAIAAATGER